MKHRRDVTWCYGHVERHFLPPFCFEQFDSVRDGCSCSSSQWENLSKLVNSVYICKDRTGMLRQKQWQRWTQHI